MLECSGLRIIKHIKIMRHIKIIRHIIMGISVASCNELQNVIFNLLQFFFALICLAVFKVTQPELLES